MMEHDATRDDALVTRLIARDQPEFESAMALVFGGEPHFDRENRRRFNAFQAIADQQGLRYDLLVGAFCGGRILSAALAVESPGKTAILYIPPTAGPSRRQDASEAAVAALTVQAHDRGVVLVQGLLGLHESEQATALSNVGYRYLAELIYMDRTVGDSGPNINSYGGLRFHTYLASDRERYVSTIAATYQESLDCPALTPLRDLDDVITGHEATGVYDPRGWILATDGSEPAGVILLAGVPRRSAVEVVYMGVVRASRGKGVGNALLHRADAYARSRGADVVTLAVDSTNAPAKKLYARWMFRETSRRRAWIHVESQR